MEKFKNYFSHSWGDLTQEKGWWKPVLILALVNCIPILGQIVTIGYMLEWAKEASWGLTRPFTHEIGDLGKRCKYGLFAIVVSVVWLAPLWIAMQLVAFIPLIGMMLVILCEAAYLIASVVAIPATLRAITYERIAPGLQIGRILKMAGKDSGGLLRCFCISLIGALAVIAIACVVVVPIVGAGALVAIPAYDSAGYGAYGFGMDYGYTSTQFAPLAAALAAALPLLLVVGFACTFVQTLFNMVTLRAYGYWLGQFKPSQWGRAEDPMPFEREEAARNGAQWRTYAGAGFEGQPGAWGPEAYTGGQRPDAPWPEEPRDGGQSPQAEPFGEQAFYDAAEQDVSWSAWGADAGAGDASGGAAADEDVTIVRVESAADADGAQGTGADDFIEEVGTVKPEETVGAGDDAGDGDFDEETASPGGWRSATNASSRE